MRTRPTKMRFFSRLPIGQQRRPWGFTAKRRSKPAPTNFAPFALFAVRYFFRHALLGGRFPSLFFSLEARRVFSRENPGHNGLHQATRVAAAISAHQPADGVAGGVQSPDGFIIEIQRFTT